MSFCKTREVLITEPVDECCAKILVRNGMAVTTKIGLSKEELLQEIKKFDGLIVRSATKVTKELIDAADRLRVIGRAGTGVDNIDCDAATLRGIVVINAPGGNAISAAELTCGMIVSLSRNIPEACASLKSGKWDRKSFMGHELMGKTLGIVGLGRIGREVAIRMQSFGMKTIGYDPIIPPDVSKGFGVESFELEELWPKCDYITVHTPLIPQTKHLINTEVLMSKCKKGVKIVNCARGGIVDEDALLKALESGQCDGAGLDVFVEEPPQNTALIQHPKVICTPHLGASTHDAQIRVAEEIARQFVDLSRGRYVEGIVNCPTLSESFNESNRSWVAITTALGKLLGSIMSKGSKITGELLVYGDEQVQRGKLLPVSTMVGLLKGQSIEGPNLVNAPVLAKDAGIEVTYTYGGTNQPNELSCSVMLTATSDSGIRHTAIGTVYHDYPVLCALDGCAFRPAIQLGGKLIFCCGQAGDRLPVRVITFLSTQGSVTSAYMSSPQGSRMWCIMMVDADVPDCPQELSDAINFWVQIKF